MTGMQQIGSVQVKYMLKASWWGQALSRGQHGKGSVWLQGKPAPLGLDPIASSGGSISFIFLAL